MIKLTFVLHYFGWNIPNNQTMKDCIYDKTMANVSYEKRGRHQASSCSFYFDLYLFFLTFRSTLPQIRQKVPTSVKWWYSLMNLQHFSCDPEFTAFFLWPIYLSLVLIMTSRIWECEASIFKCRVITSINENQRYWFQTKISPVKKIFFKSSLVIETSCERNAILHFVFGWIC